MSADVRIFAIAVVHIQNRTVFDAFGYILKQSFSVVYYSVINVFVAFEFFDIAIYGRIESRRRSKNFSYSFGIVTCPVYSVYNVKEFVYCAFDFIHRQFAF